LNLEGSQRKSLLLSFMRQAVKLVVLGLLRAYKFAISPMVPPSCRYVPTCSEYAIEAVERYGALRGGLIAFWRLLRCHPFAHGGYDPVVKHKENPRPSASSGQAFSQTTRETGHPATQVPNLNDATQRSTASSLNGAVLNRSAI
jgi:putative membrane protein insertion efficiency factor